MTTDVRIRTGKTDDAERLKAIGVTGWETTYAEFIEPANRQKYLAGKFWSLERLREVIENQRCDVLVAEIDGQIAGFITMEPHDETTAELTRLYVDPEFRSGGIGQKLWQAALETLRARGVTDVLVNVFGDNTHGRRFYERLGFTLIEETTTEVGTQTVYDVWYRLTSS